MTPFNHEPPTDFGSRENEHEMGRALVLVKTQLVREYPPCVVRARVLVDGIICSQIASSSVTLPAVRIWWSWSNATPVLTHQEPRRERGAADFEVCLLRAAPRAR